jgi:hypothetical protein
MTTKKDNIEMGFFARFAKAQLKYLPLYKDTKGYGYNYANLTQVIDTTKEALISNDVYFQQTVENNLLKTYLLDLITGEKQLACEFEIVSASVKGANELQQMGAGISYLRRYSLMLALGLATEDDDASNVKIPIVKKATTIDTNTHNEIVKLKAQIHNILLDNAENKKFTNEIINWANTNIINNPKCEIHIAKACLIKLQGLIV